MILITNSITFFDIGHWGCPVLSVATPTCFWLLFSCTPFSVFPPICVFESVVCLLWTVYNESCSIIHFTSPGFLIRVYPLIFNGLADKVGLMSAILLFVFCICPFSSSLPQLMPSFMLNGYFPVYQINFLVSFAILFLVIFFVVTLEITINILV